MPGVVCGPRGAVLVDFRGLGVRCQGPGAGEATGRELDEPAGWSGFWVYVASQEGMLQQLVEVAQGGEVDTEEEEQQC